MSIATGISSKLVNWAHGLNLGTGADGLENGPNATGSWNFLLHTAGSVRLSPC